MRDPFDTAVVSAFAEIFNNVAIHAYQRTRRRRRSRSRSRRADRELVDRDQGSRPAVRHRRRRAAADRARRGITTGGRDGHSHREDHARRDDLRTWTTEPVAPVQALAAGAGCGRREEPAVTPVRTSSAATTRRRSRFAARSTSTPRRRSPRRSTGSSRRKPTKVIVDLSGARPDRQLGRRRAGQALQGRARRRRHRSRSPARAISRSRSSSCCAWTRSSTCRRVRVLAITKIFPNAAEPLSAPFNRQQFAALRAALRARGAWRRSRGSRAPGWSRGGRAPASSRACRAARRSPASTSRIRARCSCRGSRTARGGRCTPRRSRRALARYRGKVDVVLGSWAYPDGFAAVIAARLLGVPCVVKLHGSRHQRDREAARAARG